MQHQELINSLRSRYYNPADINQRQKLQALLDLDYTVVCTSRPLPGEVAWEGEWCGGRHWAAGNLVQYAKMWKNLDGAIILLVDNNKLFQIAKANHSIRFPTTNSTKKYPTWDEACIKYTPQRLVKMLVPEAIWCSVD